MAGGFMQLLTYGCQDLCLTDNDFYYYFEGNWCTFERSILPSDINNVCPITLEKINLNDTYCMCLECNYIFDAKELKIAIQTQHECPMCLSEWKLLIEYINK